MPVSGPEKPDCFKHARDLRFTAKTGHAVVFGFNFLLAILYLAASKFGFIFAYPAEQVTVIWPPTGISVAALLLFGYRTWPGIMLGAFLANITTHEPVLTALAIAVGNTLEALCGAWMMTRFTNFANGLCRIRDIVNLVIFSAILSTIIGAVVGVTALCLGGVQPWDSYEKLFFLWWLGDAGGALLVAPFFLIWMGQSFKFPSARILSEVVILLAGLVLYWILVFNVPADPDFAGSSFKYMIFPFLIWVAARFGHHGTTFVTVAAAGAMIWSTTHGLGPFGHVSTEYSIIYLQIFLIVVAMTGLFISAAIAERQAAENIRGFLASIVESSEEAIVSKTLEGIITFWNAGAQRLFGYEPGEAIGRHISLIIPPDRLHEEEEIIAKMRRGERIEHLDTVRIDKSGHPIDVSATLSPVRDSTGTVIGVSKIARDITERKRAEERLHLALTQSQLYQIRLESILNNIVDGLVTLDERGTIQSFNRACERIFGYKGEEIIGKNINVLLPNDHALGYDQFLPDHQTGQTRIANMVRELQGRKKDGTFFPMELSVAEVKLGSLRLFSGIIRDITERKTAEKKLKAAHNYLENVLDHIPDPIFMKDRQHRWIGGNKAFWNVMGGPAEQFLGKSDYDFFPRQEADVFWERDDKVFNSGQVDINEEFFTDSEGRRHILSTKKTAFPDDSGEKILIGVIRDITEMKTIEEKLRQYTKKLERSNQELDDFAYIASHDLKEPLRGLIIQASFMLEDYRGKLDADGIGRLQRMVQLGERMGQLVSNLLYYSRLGRTELAVQEVDPNEIIAGIRQMLASLLTEKNARIIVPEPMPGVVCDKPRMTEVFTNLITNAIKYNDKPEPIVEIGFLETVQAPHGQEKNVFYVKDNGVGIDPRFHNDIFGIFKRLPKSSEYDESGTGVGLTFVKKIIQRFNGRVWLESEPGQGTVFYFTFQGNEADHDRS